MSEPGRHIQHDLDAAPDRIHFWDDSEEHVKAAAKLGWNAWLYEGPQSIARVP